MWVAVKRYDNTSPYRWIASWTYNQLIYRCTSTFIELRRWYDKSSYQVGDYQQDAKTVHIFLHPIRIVSRTYNYCNQVLSACTFNQTSIISSSFNENHRRVKNIMILFALDGFFFQHILLLSTMRDECNKQLTISNTSYFSQRWEI